SASKETPSDPAQDGRGKPRSPPRGGPRGRAFRRTARNDAPSGCSSARCDSCSPGGGSRHAGARSGRLHPAGVQWSDSPYDSTSLRDTNAGYAYSLLTWRFLEKLTPEFHAGQTTIGAGVKGNHMRKTVLAVAGLIACSLAHAQTDVLIEVDRGRTEGFFSKSPVFQRAILTKPAQPTDTALLFFRGDPGIARIQTVGDKQRNLIPFLRMNQRLIAEEGIALVIMDCPTDQWSMQGYYPSACRDDYR